MLALNVISVQYLYYNYYYCAAHGFKTYSCQEFFSVYCKCDQFPFKTNLNLNYCYYCIPFQKQENLKRFAIQQIIYLIFPNVSLFLFFHYMVCMLIFFNRRVRVYKRKTLKFLYARKLRSFFTFSIFQSANLLKKL